MITGYGASSYGLTAIMSGISTFTFRFGDTITNQTEAQTQTEFY